MEVSKRSEQVREVNIMKDKGEDFQPHMACK